MGKQVVALVGASAVGKSFTEELLSRTYGYKRAISYTTRPCRDYEIDGVHYFFVTLDEIHELKNEGLLVEHTQFNGWEYGISVGEFEDCDIVVIEPQGLKQIIDNVGRNNVYIVYLTLSDEERMKRVNKRGDKDVNEIKRRFEADRVDMQGMEQMADLTIVNHNSFETARVIDLIIKSMEE